nr:hypothetical protein [uncultured Treponema sp.]
MNILELKNIEREEGAIYYFRKYTAEAVLELPIETVSTPISFSIETGPFGERKISVKVIEAPNYPVLPLLSALKAFILDNDKEGRLP